MRPMKGEDICIHITENIFFVRYNLILTALLPGPISKFTDYRQFDSKMKISIYTICSKNLTNKDFHEISLLAVKKQKKLLQKDYF